MSDDSISLATDALAQKTKQAPSEDDSASMARAALAQKTSVAPKPKPASAPKPEVHNPNYVSPTTQKLLGRYNTTTAEVKAKGAGKAIEAGKGREMQQRASEQMRVNRAAYTAPGGSDMRAVSEGNRRAAGQVHHPMAEAVGAITGLNSADAMQAIDQTTGLPGAGAQFLKMLSDPGNIAIMMTMPELHPLIQRIVSGAFALSMGKGAVEMARSIKPETWAKMKSVKGMKSLNPEEQKQIALLAGHTVMTTLAGAHAAGAGPHVSKFLDEQKSKAGETKAKDLQYQKNAVKALKPPQHPNPTSAPKPRVRATAGHETEVPRTATTKPVEAPVKAKATAVPPKPTKAVAEEVKPDAKTVQPSVAVAKGAEAQKETGKQETPEPVAKTEQAKVVKEKSDVKSGADAAGTKIVAVPKGGPENTQAQEVGWKADETVAGRDAKTTPKAPTPDIDPVVAKALMASKRRSKSSQSQPGFVDIQPVVDMIHKTAEGFRVGKLTAGILSKRVADAYREVFDPANLSKEAGATARTMRHTGADMARERAVTAAAILSKEAGVALKTKWNRLSERQQIEFHLAMDEKTGSTLPRDVQRDMRTARFMMDHGTERLTDAYTRVVNAKDVQAQAAADRAAAFPTSETKRAARAAKDAAKRAEESVPDWIKNPDPDYWRRSLIDKVPKAGTAMEKATAIANRIQSRSAENREGLYAGKRPLAGGKGYTKERTRATLRESIEGPDADKELRYKNPFEHIQRHLHEVEKQVMALDTMAQEKTAGRLKYVNTADVQTWTKRGWAKVDDPSFRVRSLMETTKADGDPGAPVLVERGQWMMPEGSARVMNNYLKPGLAGNAGYDLTRRLTNNLNMAQLGLSAFHLTAEAINSKGSAVGLGLKALTDPAISGKIRGKLVAKGVVSAFPVVGEIYAPVADFLRGNKMLKEYYDEGGQGAEFGKAVDALQSAGGRAHMEHSYDDTAIAAFGNAWQSGQKMKALAHGPFAAFASIGHVIMHEVVPRVKMGAFMETARYEFDRLEKTNPHATTDQKREVMARAWDSIDNRFGQLVYDNIFMNRTMKDVAMLTTRAVGWNLGTLREFAGSMADTATPRARMKSGDSIVSHRMAYVAGLTVSAAVTGAFMQKLMTGKNPESLKDYFYPQTGKTLSNGKPERLQLPTYLRDVAPVGLELAEKNPVGAMREAAEKIPSKLHPAVSTAWEMASNKDWKGTPIADEDASVFSQFKSYMNYIVGQYTPISLRKKSVRDISGITTAPRKIDDPDRNYRTIRVPKAGSPKTEGQKLQSGLKRETSTK